MVMYLLLHVLMKYKHQLFVVCQIETSAKFLFNN